MPGLWPSPIPDVSARGQHACATIQIDGQTNREGFRKGFATLEDRRFDLLTKELGKEISRRKGMRAIIGAALGIAGFDARETLAAKKATRRHEKPACRNANSQCASDDECCSGRCVEKFGGTGFRCAKNHGKKKGGKKNGGGGLTPIPTGMACDVEVDVCADAAATCEEYDSEDPSGTYCVLPTGAACSADDQCFSQSCGKGTCDPVTCTVCEDGCPYDSIEGALNGLPPGSRIKIDAGAWAAPSGNVDGGYTFEACGKVAGVHITTNGAYAYIDVGAGTYRFKGLTFDPPGSPRPMVFLQNHNTGPELANIFVFDCDFNGFASSEEDAAYGLYPFGYFSIVVEDSTFNRAPIEGASIGAGDTARFAITRSTLSGTDYSSAFRTLGSATITITDSEITGGNTRTGSGITLEDNGDPSVVISLTLNGTTSVTGNAASTYGGGLALVTNSAGTSYTVVMADSSSITANSSPNGSGIAAIQGNAASATYAFTGTSTRVTANTGSTSQCEKSTDNGGSWTSVPDCTSF